MHLVFFFFYKVKILYPILIASFALACGGLSLIALLLGSWYIEKYAIDNGSKWLLVLTILSTLLSCMLNSIYKRNNFIFNNIFFSFTFLCCLGNYLNNKFTTKNIR